MQKSNTKAKTAASNVVNYINSETVKWPLSKVMQNLQFVKIDDNFQSPARWDEKQMRDFFHNLFRGIAPSKYIFASVEDCQANSAEAEDRDYYQKWNAVGAKYLNLDSNNRWTSLIQLFTSNIGLRRGTYYDKDNNSFKIKEGATWKDLDDDVKNFILNVKITVEIYNSATRAQLSDIFIAVNSGTALNPAEKRNAIISDISDVCRELGVYYYNDLKTSSKIVRKLFTNKQYNRRAVDEYFAWLSVINQYGVHWKITQSSLTEGYQPGSLLCNGASDFKKKVNIFFKDWINPYETQLCELSRLSINSILDLFVFYSNYSESIKDKDAFIKKFLKTTERLVGSTMCDHRIENRAYTFGELLRSREYKFSQKRHNVYLDEFSGTGLIVKKTPTCSDSTVLDVDVTEEESVEVIN